MSVIDVRGRYPIAVAWPRLRMDTARVDAIAIHHSVTPTPAANWTVAQELAVLDAIYRHHVAQGFGGNGYHFCGFPSGRWYYTASLAQWGANVAGENNHVYGVCVIGTYTEGAPIITALRAAALSVDYIDRFLRRLVGLRSHGKIYGGWTATRCPGEQLARKVPTLRSLIAPPLPEPEPPKPEPEPPEPEPIPPPVEEEDEMRKLSFIRVKGTLTVYLVEKDRLVHAVNSTHWQLTRGEPYDFREVEPTDGILDIPTLFPLGVPAKQRK